MLKFKTLFLFALTIVAVLAIALPASAIEESAPDTTAVSPPAEEEKDWFVEVSDAFMSKYLWRGIRLNDDWVMQPSVSAGYKWFTATVWSNYDMTDSNADVYPDGNAENKITEIDYILDFTYEFEKVGFSLGYNYYDFPNTGYDATGEVYGSVFLNVLLKPTLTVYYDTIEVEGFYATFKIGHTFEEVLKSGPMTLGIDVSGGVSAGNDDHNEFYYGVDDTAFTDAFALLSLPVGIGDYFSITPTAIYTVLVDDRIRDNFKDDENSFCYGAVLTLSF